MAYVSNLPPPQQSSASFLAGKQVKKNVISGSVVTIFFESRAATDTHTVVRTRTGDSSQAYGRGPLINIVPIPLWVIWATLSGLEYVPGLYLEFTVQRSSSGCLLESPWTQMHSDFFTITLFVEGGWTYVVITPVTP